MLNNPVLEVSNLSFRYPGMQSDIFSNISFNVNQGEFIGIVGGNGSGKTTLIKLLLGILTPNQGNITIQDKTLAEVRNKIGYVSQYEDIDLSFPITAQDVVRSGRITQKWIYKFTSEDNSETEAVMKQLEIWHLKESLLSELSGGQKQKVFLARAMVNDPEIIILDEPLSNIDMESRKYFYEMLNELKGHKTILVIDHNLRMLVPYVDKILCVNSCNHEGVTVHESDIQKLLDVH